MEKIFLHLGCGDKFIPGFIHVDIKAAPHVDKVGSVADLPDFHSESVDLIYASHVLEHFGRYEFQAVLAEWSRVLKPRGVLRLSVPNFAACVEQYLHSGRLDGERSIIGLICGGQRNEFDYHKMIFDRTFLIDALTHAGFSEFRDWNWQNTSHSSVDDYSQAYLPHMDKLNGALMSLNIEAVK